MFDFCRHTHSAFSIEPFEADTAHGVLIKAATEDAAPLGGTQTPSDEAIDEDLAAVVKRCLEKDQPNRYRSAAALASDLERYLAGEEVLARPLSGSERANRAFKKHKHTVGLFAMIASVLVIIMVAFLFTLFGMRSTDEQIEGAIGDAQTRLATIAEHPAPEVQALAAEARRIRRLAGLAEIRRLAAEARG